MARIATDKGTLDRWAMALSGLCMVHCLAGAIVVSLLASAGGLLVDPIIHEIGLGVAILLGAVAIGRGIYLHGLVTPAAIAALGLALMTAALTVPHGAAETVFTMLGVAILALGHYLNRRALV